MTRVSSIYILIFVLLTACNQQSEKKAETKAESKPKPNILIIVADDLAFSDIGCFGGNVHTPVIDKIAKEGVSFSNFHVQPSCSPTRSSLLTGNDNHITGLGIMSEMDYPVLHNKNLPGYSGNLSKQVVTIPELLRDSGYHTYMTGKWHLGEGAGMDPYERGFEQTFILGTGGGSHFSDLKALSPLQHMDYTYNGKPVALPEDFYSSRNYTDSMIQFIDKNKADKKPFFAYLSYTAVHDPLHAPKEYIEKYKGKFDMGWDSLYAMRLNSLRALGIIPKDLSKFIKNPSIPAWNKLPANLKKDFARDMEVYAATLDYMDMSIGRVMDYLKKENMYDNTMIVFMSDNGGNGAMATSYPGNGDHKYLNSFNNVLENRGLKNSYIEAGPGWTQASTAPFRLFKLFTTEGGIRAPLIVKMPGTAKNQGQWNKSFCHVTDLMPTVLQLTGVSYPSTYKGNNIHALIGKSMIPLLNGEAQSIHENDGMGWEIFEMKAYIKGNWKILRLPIPMGSGDWQLYDLEKDPGETTDLSKEHPEIRTELINLWKDYAKQNELYDHNGHYDSLYRKSFGVEEKD